MKKEQQQLIKVMLEQMNWICSQFSRGPGTEEFSLKCSLASMNGNFPRVKKKTFARVRENYLAVCREYKVKEIAVQCE